MKRKLIFLGALTVAVTSAAVWSHSAKANQRQATFGACYTLYNCQGGSIGSFTDIQCRTMGGRSIDSAGVCFNL